jgi:GAF domain-containing protein
MDLSQRRYRPWLLVASVVAPLAVAAVSSLVREQVINAAAVLILVLVVVAASSTGVRLPGFLAALSSGAFFDLFLTQPYGTLAVSNPDDVEALVLLLAVGLAVTELALWGCRQQAGASRRLGYLDGVLSTAEKIAAEDPDPADLVALVGTELTGLLGLDGCRYALVAPHLRTVIQPDGHVRSGERHLDVDRHGLPIDEEILLPVRSAAQAVGGFVLTSATRVRRPTSEQLRVAVLLADQVGTVVARRR